MSLDEILEIALIITLAVVNISVLILAIKD
jgi:hypothetical protein